ncbi:MAG TPA: ABC transporter permease [Pyrinomonadaceae bacterium]|nr:ABC transporter permease [Pyrinomonadaceae bacterium]
MRNLLQDIRYGLRILWKSPGFALVTILALAIGIGANTAIFSVVNGVLLRPLPFKTSDRLVFLSEWSQQVPDMSVSYPNYQDWRDQSTVFEQLAAFRSAGYILTGAGEPERLTAREVSASFFPALGVTPALGRNFNSDEDKPSANRTAILSYGLWQRRFGGNPNIVGQAITLNNQSYTVVGVLPQTFEWQAPVDLFVPIETGLGADLQVRDDHPGIYLIGTLKDGVTVEQARAELTTITSRLAQQYPKTNEGNGFAITKLQDRATQDIRAALLIVLAAVGFMLLIACANVANLLLARAATRAKEIAIRTALGAGRWRIIRQLLTESILLALAGGALGLLFAIWGVDALRAFIPDEVPRLLVTSIHLDTRVLLFTLIISIVTGLIFGLAPALQVSKSNLNEALKEGGRSATAGAQRNYVRSLLVVSEVAISLLLLVGAGLLMKSFLNLQRADIGFNPDHVLTTRISLPEARYKENAQIENFYRALLQRVQNLPGVQYAGLTRGLPMSGGIESGITIEGHEVTDRKDTIVAVNLTVSPDYFRAMEIPLLKGRYFTDQDKTGSPDVVLIDEMLASRYFANTDPIGKRIRLGGMDNKFPWMQIVGVVKHVKHYGPDEEGRVEIYRPYFQLLDVPDARFNDTMTLAVRTTGEPTSMTGAIRNAVLEIDKDQPISQVQPMTQIVAASVSSQKFATWLLAIFAAVALLLAALGLYGVMVYSVTQRTHEIGIRMALGARARDVLKLVIGHGMTLALIGVAAGLAAAFALTRLMSSLLFGVSATDPLTFTAITLFLLIVALLACYLPARRAAKVDPMVALRYE